MTEKRKHMSREELRAFVDSELATQQAERNQRALTFAEAVIKQLAMGKFRVRWDGDLTVHFRLRFSYPQIELVNDILREYGYEMHEWEEVFHYWWTVDVKLIAPDTQPETVQ